MCALLAELELEAVKEQYTRIVVSFISSKQNRMLEMFIYHFLILELVLNGNFLFLISPSQTDLATVDSTILESLPFLH